VVQKIWLYDPDTGRLADSEKLAVAYTTAQAEKKRLIALVLIDDQMIKEIYYTLASQFHGRRAVRFKQSRLIASSTCRGGANPTWVNLALRLAQAAGAVPWDLDGLRGVDEKTVVVGMDLGHDHKKGKSRVALTLIDHRGRPVDGLVVDCAANDERIPAEILTQNLPRFLFWQDRPSPTQVIVHRDGRYFDGEIDNLLDGLSSVERVSLVSIKKHPVTRFVAEKIEGACLKIDPQRALLVTNGQARKTGMPVPLEVELNEPGDRTLGEIVPQVFWLTRVCQGNAYHPSRLPVTTGWADTKAATGKTLRFKGWEPQGE